MSSEERKGLVETGETQYSESSEIISFFTRVKSHPFVSALFFLLFINGVILTVFSFLSATEIILEWDWFKPGFYALLYTIVAGLGILLHVAALIWMWVSKNSYTLLTSKRKTFIYVVTVLYVLVYTVNLILAWSFYGLFCPTLSPLQNDGKTGIFNCICPSYYDDSGNQQTVEWLELYFLYQNVHLVNAIFLPLLVVSLVVLKNTVLGDYWGFLTANTSTTKTAYAKKHQAETTTALMSKIRQTDASSHAYWWFSSAFYIANVVFFGLAFVESIYSVDFLQPFPLALSFTIVGGVLLLATAITLIILSVNASKKLEKSVTGNVPEGVQVTTREPLDVALWILLYFTGAFVVYLVGLWVFYGKHCFDENGDYIEDCSHPIDASSSTTPPEDSSLNLYGFSTLNAFIGFLFPLSAFMLARHFFSLRERGISIFY